MHTEKKQNNKKFFTDLKQNLYKENTKDKTNKVLFQDTNEQNKKSISPV